MSIDSETSIGGKKELQKFFYNNVIYVIDIERLNFVMEKLGIKMNDLSTTKNISSFLEENGLLIEEFLELISVCWMKN